METPSDHQGTVFLVDDDEAQRTAMKRLLGACGFRVLVFEDAEAFLDAFDPALPGCLLLDLRMPGRSGLELQIELERLGSLLPIVFLTGHADVATSVFAMKQGAVDFLQKPVEEQTLIAALESALARDGERRREHGELVRLRSRHDKLTAREREVLEQMMAGLSNKQVARVLGIAERTVKLHRSRVFTKMAADSLAELVRMAERLGLGPGAS